MPAWNAGLDLVVAARKGAIVRAAEGLNSPIVCVLPRGVRVVCAPGFFDAAAARVPIAAPVAGWLSGKTVKPRTAADGEDAAAGVRSRLLEAMARARSRTLNDDGNPLDACFHCACALVEEVRADPALVEALGEPDNMSGSYDAAGSTRARPSWWPEEYTDWLPHSFVRCAGGTIADCSADQFDADIPMLHVCETGDAGVGRFSFSKDASKSARLARFEFRRAPGAKLSMDEWLRMTGAEPSHSDVVRAAWTKRRSRRVNLGGRAAIEAEFTSLRGANLT